MTKIIYDQQTIQQFSLFETITHAKCKDCFFDEVQNRLVFIVDGGHLWKALGKKSENVKKLEDKFGKKIKIVEYSNNLLTFIKNMVQPLRINKLEEEEGIITITEENMQTKGLLIGRNAKNLRNLETNIRRFFDIKEIKVV
ncbi:NusA-like transcription termination signal-binding factor [Candidatus Woesearchaeota archaeon]|jgi:transcription termination/antitermination protein NusA|nr:NusA-like transcription termination signal-binding factor [Candidatus Woesearchaeota archaeon]MBT6519370.1 NusA-like transcription termination signal-binding factor [Candidatus Woesearchaeota archaeon]MBT7367786.1 NusA-like transcription termination signal-binding factor [Candidatus Woesearchaeota archaeon]